jgi:hypothetical protein
MQQGKKLYFYQKYKIFAYENRHTPEKVNRYQLGLE